MSKPANTSLIGAFVLGGIILLIVGIGLFGAGRFGSPKASFICFFEDSVNGLDIGSPVKFKGVTIGKVAQVFLHTRNQNENDNAVPVVIEIDQNLLSSRGLMDHLENATMRDEALKKGLRARLQQQSLLTGMLYVDLDFYPKTEIKYHKQTTNDGLIEVPTVSSNHGTVIRAATQTMEQFGRIQFAAMGEKMDRILAQLEEGVGAVEFKKINQGVLSVTASANELLNDKQLRQVADNLNAALKAVRELSQSLDGQVAPLSQEVQKTADEARKTLAQIHLAAENLRLLTQPGTGLRGSLDETLQQVADAAAALRTLANYLERQPNVLITGKAAAKETAADGTDAPPPQRP
ncbi:MAG: MlaD family protein [Puniceicoccales bacterium]|jgi:paraquat-inducible protein B|nr:MlaD family protein [Puniceicoccales bacterium]